MLFVTFHECAACVYSCLENALSVSGRSCVSQRRMCLFRWVHVSRGTLFLFCASVLVLVFVSVLGPVYIPGNPLCLHFQSLVSKVTSVILFQCSLSLATVCVCYIVLSSKLLLYVCFWRPVPGNRVSVFSAVPLVTLRYCFQYPWQRG